MGWIQRVIERAFGARGRAGRRLCLSVVVLAGAGLAGCTGTIGGTAGDSDGGSAGDEAEAIARVPRPVFAPKRVILLIGDGMGIGQLSAGTYAAQGALHMLSMKSYGLMTTHGHEFVTTDSAASATAIAAGDKTHSGGVSVSPGTTSENETNTAQHLASVVETAERLGWKTGLVTTTSLADATPAAFGAHRASRASTEAIALDLASSDIDVLIGGGRPLFDQRTDQVDLLAGMADRGYAIAYTAEELGQLSGTSDQLVAVMADGDLAPASSEERPSLAVMTKHALGVLDAGDSDGFFLMVEGGRIDKESHLLNGTEAVAEVLDFDGAVQVALSYARGRSDTLVVVTADHETGGLAVLDPSFAAPMVDALGGEAAANTLGAYIDGTGAAAVSHLAIGDGPNTPAHMADARMTTAFGYLSVASRPYLPGAAQGLISTHTASMVPIFAEGPVASEVVSVGDNADLGRLLHDLIASNGALFTVERTPTDHNRTPRRVIVVVGDGIDVSGLSAAKYTRQHLVATDLPTMGLVATHASDRLVNDAAGAATALAVGHEVPVGAAGEPGTERAVRTLMEIADESGLRTGLVTTGVITDASLAPFFAHGGGDGADPAAALADLGRTRGTDGVDLVFSAGSDQFAPAVLDRWRERGIRVESSWSDEPAGAQEQLVRFLSAGAIDPASQRLASDSAAPSLERLTQVALDSLDRSGEDFFLLVHTGGVLGASRRFDSSIGIVDEIVDFDGAVAAAYEYARNRDDTALVVLSQRASSMSVLDNHYGFTGGSCAVAARCGGPVVFEDIPIAVEEIHNGSGLTDTELQGEFAPPSVILQYAWLPQRAAGQNGGELSADPASANLVPLFAAGTGREQLAGFRRLADVGAVLAGWLSAPATSNE